MEAAVAGYAEGVLKSSVGKLGSFLLSEALLIGSVREDIVFLRDELQSMDAVVRDLLSAGQLNHQNKIWMLHVLQLACDAELCIDEFTSSLGGHCGRGISGTVRRGVRFANTIVPRYRIAKMIQELKNRAKEVSARRARYGTAIQEKVPDTIKTTHGTHEGATRLIRNSHLIAEDALVGIDKETLSNVTTIPQLPGMTVIVGPAGSGKTALAKMIYRRRNHPDNQIEASAWVTLSRKRDKRSVLEDIMRQVDGFREGIENGNQLEEKLKNHLDQKRFLVVLDSLTSQADWEQINSAFPESSKGTIIVTTRVIKVDDIFGPNIKTDKIIDLHNKTLIRDQNQKNQLCSNLIFDLTSMEESKKNMKNSKYKLLNQILGWFHFVLLELFKIVLKLFPKLWHFLKVLWNLMTEVWTKMSGVVLACIPHSESLQNRLAHVKTNVQNLMSVVFLIIIATPVALSIIFGAALLKKVVRRRATTVEGIPLNRVNNYWRLTCSGILEFSSLVPLEIKFICGALAAGSMDSNATNEFFKKIHSLATLTMDERLVQVTKSCYDLMSPSLKLCAQDLYNILPDCSAVSRKRLTRRWVALSLVSPAQGLNSEEVAECYFDELQIRSFIEPQCVHPTGKTKTCRINSFFKEVDQTLLNCTENSGENQQTQSNYAENSGNNKKISNHDDVSFQLYDILPSTGVKWDRKQLLKTNSQLLTIIDLEGCKGLDQHDFNSLCGFVNLRFLSLRNTDVAEVPRRIRKLQHLETLDIRQTKIEKVPKDILYLQNLKHLLAGCFYKPECTTGAMDSFIVRSIEMPIGMEEMSGLQKLAYVNATRASNLLSSLRELTQLRKLGLVIRDKKLNSRPLSISLMMLCASLRSLSICDEREKSSLDFLEYLCFPPHNLTNLTLMGHLGRLPQWVSNHKLLSKLTLSRTHLKSDAIRLIGKIPTLLCLKLYEDSFQEHLMKLEIDEFPVLKVLIIHCHVIQTICFEEGTTPQLEIFRWVFSRAETGELYGVENLLMLKEVSLIGEISSELESNIKAAVEKGSDRKSMPVFETVKKKKPIMQSFARPSNMAVESMSRGPDC